MNENKKKRRIKKGKLAQFVFIVLSFMFLIFCLVFYGQRLIKYYRIYNPKGEDGKTAEILSTNIAKNRSVVFEGDGLYMVNGIYLFKGNVKDNYVKLSGLLWRIVKINTDNSIEIILDEPINNLMWNSRITDYNNTDVNKYLNDVFLRKLNKKLLVNSVVCLDTVESIDKITCEKTDKENYVKLISITDYLNSKTKSSYINMEENSLWLSDRGKTNVWYADGYNISLYDPKETYLIKPVVTLNMNNALVSGNGTKNKPFTFEKDKKELTIGKYVKLDNDNWIIYEENKDSVKMVLADNYQDDKVKNKFDASSNIFSTSRTGSIAQYLNTKFYDSINYRGMLLSSKWYVGSYNTSYKDIYKKEVTAKVGMQNIADMKFNLQETSSYLLTPGGTGKAYVFGKQLTVSKVTNTSSIRPAIEIKKYNIKKGNGTSKSPYEMEG
jgi:hypothetical protein